MSNDGSYAGQIEIYAVSELLEKNIKTFTLGRGGELKDVELGYIKYQGLPNIFLYHNDGFGTASPGVHHFELLIHKSDKLFTQGGGGKRRVRTNKKRKGRRVNRTGKKNRRSIRKGNRRSRKKERTLKKRIQRNEKAPKKRTLKKRR